ncbi:hypothetical protein BDZ97DRAFT_1821224 [Flammula alnicola]|nr:hypothetical protein BDZ97DRAFT_1821224 [Flammula alnicola]
MNRRHGMEAMMGLGGGMVSEESRRNLEKAEDLCRKRKPNLAVPYLLKAIKDNNNLDAIIQVAFLLDMPGAIEALEAAELRGRVILKKALGNDCFDDEGDSVGHFWGILETRPYMRVLQALVRLYFESGRVKESAQTIIEMLRLCPGDNMGQRSWLGSILCQDGRYADALHFSQEWLSDETCKIGTPPPRGGTAFKDPVRNFLKSKKEDLKWADGATLYTAALASFKLFGDYEESREYLKVAAKTNPNVLLKILARVQRPSKLNNDPRTMNGPEDAQDYLWLTQNLWMEDDVWNWANTNPAVKNVVLKVCSRAACGMREVRAAEYKRCSACHLVSYCSVACQKDDWPNHKPACLAHRKQKATLRAFQLGKAPPRDSPMPMFATDVLGGMPTMPTFK